MLRPSALHQHTQCPGRGLQCTQNIQMMQWERATRSLREDGCPSGEGTGHARFIGCFPVPFLKQVKQRGENDICLGFFTAKTINKCVLLSSSHSCHLRLCFPCCLLLPCQSIYILWDKGIFSSNVELKYSSFWHRKILCCWWNSISVLCSRGSRQLMESCARRDAALHASTAGSFQPSSEPPPWAPAVSTHPSGDGCSLPMSLWLSPLEEL